MSTKTDALKTSAEIIKNETTAGQNTATRLGAFLIALINYLEDPDNLAEKSELPQMSSYALKTWVTSAIANLASKSEIPSLTGYALQSWVLTQLNSFLPLADFGIKADSEGYAKQSWVTGKNYLPMADLDIAIEALSKYAKLTDIPSLSGYAKLTDLPSMEGYARLADIPSLDGVATTEDLLDYMPKEEAKTFHDNVDARVKVCEEKTKHLGIIPYSHGDADSLVNTAKYYLSEDVDNVPSVPCYVEVMGYDSSFVVQRSIMLDGVIKQRIYNGTSWSEWRTI